MKINNSIILILKPTISLIIATYNWEEALSLSLKYVLKQSILPDEIIIADDGSRLATKAVIDYARSQTTIPIIHVWHEDNGFRLSEIRNKAIRIAKGDYIIQLDGDIIIHQHFIADHLSVAEAGYFVCGSRVKTTPLQATRFLQNQDVRFISLQHKPSHILNCLRSKILRKFLSKRYNTKNVLKLRGCNMAFWKKDLIAVNGYNQDLKGWGHEDAELAIRLKNIGVSKKCLKMGGIALHLYHNETSKEKEAEHYKILNEAMEFRLKRCNNGISNLNWI